MQEDDNKSLELILELSEDFKQKSKTFKFGIGYNNREPTKGNNENNHLYITAKHSEWHEVNPLLNTRYYV